MAETSRTDAELIDAVLAGASETFHALIERHQAPLWAAVRGFVANREDAREVFQEAWVLAFERLDQLREPGRFRSWLLSIALNLSRRRHARGAAETTGIDEAVGELADPAGAVGAGLEGLETKERVRAAIARLPPRQREVTLLRLNQDLSHREIAALLAIAEENARANLYQGMRRLRAELADLEEDRS